jgi:hypothetical protein
MKYYSNFPTCLDTIRSQDMNETVKNIFDDSGNKNIPLTINVR